MMNDFKAWVEKQIANPKVFIAHVLESLIVNEGDYRSKLNDIIANYKVGDFFNMGIDVGSLMSEATLGAEQENKHPNVESSKEDAINEVYESLYKGE